MGAHRIGTGDRSDERRAWVFAVLTGVCLALLAASMSFFFERAERRQHEMQVRQLAMAVAHDLGVSSRSRMAPRSWATGPA